MSSKKKLKVCPLSIRKLKLEAIFHPKFDNEGPDTEIRTNMLTKVAANEGYIEASLKHSGSLLLWSGGEYFYSKNSTNNVFTKVGMILLRQHFSRCFGGIKGSQEYRRCSDYIQKNRLTCSFEVVTSVLGHHGEIPKRDYLILIAVADRSDGKGRFYSTSELVKFAHQFRLPHNDTWVFSSTSTCEALFQIYNDMRETGTATAVIKQLDQIIAHDIEEDCTKVSSLYPHVIFQGDILEGIVIRYVSYTDTVGEKSSNLDEMKELCTASNELLQRVPPSQTMGQAPNISKCIHIENVDLRALLEASKGDFELKVESVNQHLGGPPRRKVEWLNGTSHEGEEARTTAITCIDIISVANEILSAPSTNKHDQETLAIAKLIQTLDELKINVSYQVFKERQGWSNDRKERCLCILHIRDDSSFGKYNTYLRQENSDGMMLYRGFCIELISNVNSDDMHDNLNELWSVYTSLSGDNDDNTTNKNKEETLMFKMKFLPYMVRTFICRNGLSILRQSGIVAFENHAITQLVKWGVSDASVRKWVPFFKGWARYCSSPDANLPLLIEKTYLHHYDKYDELYASGMFNPTDQTSSFPGLIVVVGHSKDKLKTLSQAISKVLNCSKVTDDVNKITDKDVLLAMQPSGGGLVSVAGIDSGCRNIRKLARQNHEAIYIIMIEGEDVSKQSDVNVKKMKGMTESWKKTKCNMLFDLPKESTIQPDIKTTIEYLHTNNAAKEVMSKLKSCLKDSSKSDERPGLIVYFPSIPGSGKSSLCKDIDSDNTLTCGRHVQLLEGDQVKKQGEGKFYDVVEKLLLTNPGSSITILDKNVPPISFSAIHKLCVERKCISLPVLPMGMEDTIVDNTCYPFSLRCLAVCISRVLQRQPNTHGGKLDSATDNACLICVKYYCFYRNMTEATLKEKLQTVGGYQGEEIVKVPFFKKDASSLDLPPDLKTIIEDAIILQTQDDTKKCKVSDKDKADCDIKLRSAIAKHLVYINNLTVSLDESRRSFVSELSKVITAMPSTLEPQAVVSKESSTATAAGTIKIASLDLEYEVVHTAISQLRKSSSEVDDYFAHREEHKNNDEDDPYLDRFITSVHCTYAHSSQLSNSAMISTFRHLLGSTLDIKATSLLYNDKIAAIEIEIIPTSNQLDGNIPKPQNKFHHVTIWCAKGTEAYESNALPKKVENNEAKKVDFERPIIMRGVFAFWNH